MLHILLRQPFWKPPIALTRTHLALYCRTGLTIILCSLSFFLRLYCFNFHTGWSLANVPQAFPTLALMSFNRRCIVPCDRASQVAEFLHQANSLNICCNWCIWDSIDANTLGVGGVDGQVYLHWTPAEPIDLLLLVATCSAESNSVICKVEIFKFGNECPP